MTDAEEKLLRKVAGLFGLSRAQVNAIRQVLRLSDDDDEAVNGWVRPCQRRRQMIPDGG